MKTEPCSLHGVRGCATCHKPDGRCDFGACSKPATAHYARIVGGRIVERRGLCLKHFAACREFGDNLEAVLPRAEA